MLAERTDEILGQLFALIDVAAYLAYPALFAFCLGLGLDVVLVVGVGHGLLVGENSRLSDAADEHTVGVEVDVVLNLKRHEGVDVFGQEHQSVVGAQRSADTLKGASTDRQLTFMTPVFLMTWWE